MTLNPILPGQGSLSIDGETTPFTMEAEAEYSTSDETIASDLFDMPDEPGMVRIPVKIDVMIPESYIVLLGPPEEAVADQADFVPLDAGSEYAFTQSGDYPKTTTAVTSLGPSRRRMRRREREDFRHLFERVQTGHQLGGVPSGYRWACARARMSDSSPICLA